MEVSIIIVNYNTEQLIINCIDSIFCQTSNIDYEIIVVDNNSIERPLKLLNDSRIHYIQSEANLGFGKANNLGAQFAKSDVLFFLNPDTLLINNAIKILYQFLICNETVGVCGGNLFSLNMTPTHSYSNISPSILQELLVLFKARWLVEEFNHTDTPKEVSYITGADLMIRKKIFQEIKGFDSDFFMYFEETYLCFQTTKLGKKIFNVPQAKIIHLEGKSFKLNKIREEFFFNGRKNYLLKRYNFLYYILCNLIYILTCITRIIMNIFKKDKLGVWLYRFRLVCSF